MSKTLDQLTFEEIIKDSLQANFQDHDDNFDHETECCDVPYGNTWVSAGEFVTEQSMIKCEEAFKQDFDVDHFVKEYLLENMDFRAKVQEMVNNGKFI